MAPGPSAPSPYRDGGLQPPPAYDGAGYGDAGGDLGGGYDGGYASGGEDAWRPTAGVGGGGVRGGDDVEDWD